MALLESWSFKTGTLEHEPLRHWPPEVTLTVCTPDDAAAAEESPEAYGQKRTPRFTL